MEDIMFDDIDLEKMNVVNVSAVETSYDYFRVECEIDGVYYRVLDTRNSRCSDMVFTDTSHAKSHTEWLLKKLGVTDPESKMSYIYNHNSSCWEEDVGEFDGYYGDGLDHIEELYYMD